ncbi:hypothetical protein NHX12_014215 [Muraenolepis orangiensis]|uniref:GH84 domain-containing protein n=1 Tax=Muraenolepis orangiensis TaxID=630683 RepID=A0A9Q0DD56_9TELE|nr:hypothetical protein NHX12_014215 [Muraenolepis orangiensis]
MEKDFQSAPKRFWQTIRRLRRGKRGSIQAVYSKGGTLLTSTEEVIGRWKEHFEELLNPTTPSMLRTLVVEAQSRGVSFVYALSPGQDIVFSSGCDLTLLKRKLKQAFAVLFDDIDHSMCQADSEAFSSFAHAQVSVANEIYGFLGEPPVFLFCPTVIWTGSKVISRNLSVDGVAEVASVLQRRPLIWDNLHANDYDSRRLFLGPFKGRETGLRGHLRGLLLNPNCEFEANYIPLHTLGSWHRTSPEHHPHLPCQDPREALRAALRPGQAPAHVPLSSGSPPSSPHKAQGRVPCGGKGLLSEAQVRLLVGLHYLPHEHGPAAQRLLQDLTWLKTHCHLVSANGKKSAPQKVEEWRGRASRLTALCDDIAELHCSVVGGVNRAVLYDLYPYVWDLRNTALVAKAFVCWLDGRVLGDSATLATWKNCFHWCGTTTGAELLGVDSEPWVCLGSCLALCPEYTLVLEDELGVCGCVLACRTCAPSPSAATPPGCPP